MTMFGVVHDYLRYRLFPGTTYGNMKKNRDYRSSIIRELTLLELYGN